MDARSGRDRRQNPDGLAPEQEDRRVGPDRRTLQVTEETLADIEAKLAAIKPTSEGGHGEETGWDKVIIPVK
ncbi:MAG TPA: hypothetical protein PKY22_06670 [Accumulibacter sp.]|jgi:hypothetical protein|nr:hypothetical protein [Accumulibacter sp.]